MTNATVIDVAHALFQHEGWEPGFDAVWDGRKITQLLLDENDVDEIVAQSQALSGVMRGGRAAVVVPREVDWIMARLFLLRARHPDRERLTFHTLEEAMAWLDTPPEEGPSATEEGGRAGG
ncbi:MAG TPA: hypothetical protein VD948_01700 [Rhodothermales bacterium]|nr:hypothetical protein [Rhodothermales bacterium]